MVSGFSTDGDGDGATTAVSIWRWRWSNNRSLHINSQRPVLCQLCLPLCLSVYLSLSRSACLSVCCLRPQLHAQINCNKHLLRTHRFRPQSGASSCSICGLLASSALYPQCLRNVTPHTHTHINIHSGPSLSLCVYTCLRVVVLEIQCKCPCHIWGIHLKICLYTWRCVQVCPPHACVCVCVCIAKIMGSRK